MTVQELLGQLVRLDVSLWMDGERLHYNAPQGVMTPELLAELAKHKGEIIAHLRSFANRNSDKLAITASLARPNQLPLSFAQQRLWFLDQFEPGSAYYNIPGAIRLTGELNLTALQQTVNEIVHRHEVLRTSFHMRDNSPTQVIAEQLDVPIHVIDLTSLPIAERENQALKLAQEEAQTPFNLSSGPLIRVSLLHLDTREHILLFTLHHIVSDGWSMGILVNEVAALYPAFLKSELSPLPELSIQYADFAHWQRQWLSGEVLQHQLDYWTKQLKGSPALLTLPTDHPRPLVESHQGTTYAFEISPQTTAGLYTLNRQTQTTLFMALVAAFNILLSRYSGQDNICIGTPIANRNRAEIENLIGFFVNTLVLRTQVDSSATFLSLLQHVRSTTLDAYAHQDAPFEQLVEVLHVERHTSHAPLFQVMLVLQNTPLGSLQLPGLTLQPVAIKSTITKFDLTLAFIEADGRLQASFEYNTDLFEPATIQRMAGHFIHLVEAIVAHPTAQIRNLPILSKEELHQILDEWNATETEYPQDKCIHELFEAQVERTPEAIALVFEDQQLTYRELNVRANQLAHYLRRHGVGPDVLVGICMERSLEMIVALLGILKAGGAYVPLDPNHPKDRLEFMLEDSQAAVLLLQARLQDRFSQHSAQTVFLDTGWQELIATQPSTVPHSFTNSSNLAYVLFTSGTTGRPKGVAIQHRNAVALFQWIKETYSPRELSGMLASTSIGFDLSVYEIFGTLSLGGCVILAENVLQLPTLAAATRVHLINTVPSAMTELLRQDSLPPFVETVNLAGEPLSTHLVDELYRVGTIQRVIDAYGPTENTTYSTFVIRQAGMAPTIGRPLPHWTTYILDKYLNPVPIGVVGELFIGGIGVARGYLNRPNLTAEKFIPNPFSRESGARMYRTGDLARWLPDGNIEFFGRIDHQVKIRGFRIELGEIEAALTALPEVQDAIVLAREDIPGDKRLVAYLVKQAGHNLPEVSELRGRLACSLPEYMLPAHFLQLEQLPLTPNGKVDRKALPAPDMTRRHIGYVAPRTPIEESLAQIWAEVLHVERAGIHDNFFELGGHSLLATQVVSRIRQTLDAEVPLRMLFQTPTVAELAEQVQTQRKIKALPLLPVTRTEPLPLSFAQERLWFLDQLEPGQSVYNIPAALRLKGALDLTAVKEGLQEITRRHEVLRTNFVVLKEQPVQVVEPDFKFTLPVIDLSDLAEAERKREVVRLVSEEARQPFDLSTGPLFRARVLRLEETEHVLILNMHHIVSDGWSLGIIFQELVTLYEAFSHGQESPLSELPIQYADFAVWQREWLQGEVLAEQLNYWKEQLSGELPVLELPTDHSRPAVSSYAGSSQAFLVPVKLARELKALSQEQDVTLFMLLLAAFQVLLAQYSGQTDLIIGSPIANRSRTEVEGLIGLFVNTLALRTDLSGDPDFVELLRRVREVCLGAYAHQDVPFEKLVQELHLERDMSRNPLFQVMFILQNTPMGAWELPDLRISGIEMENQTAKFDLTLSMVEIPQGLVGRLEYSTDLFEAATMERLVRHFPRLLEGIILNPQQRLHELLDDIELHRQLAPESTLPANVIAFPLTPGGKIDRRVSTVSHTARSESDYVAPRTSTEKSLAQIWAEVLHIDKIGVHDNFFELGGHSLLATRIVSRIRQTLDAEVSLRILFQTPTVAGLAEKIQTQQGIKALPLLSVTRNEPLHLSFAQQRLWFLDQFEPGSAYYNIPGAIRLTGELNITALQQTMNEIARRHEALRTHFAMVDDMPVQVIAEQSDVPLKVIDLTDLPATSREAHTQELIRSEAQTPFDLSTGPLIRTSLLCLEFNEHVLLFTLHHIISDGWSIGILAKEVAALYPAFVEGRDSPLTELSIQYADFAHWQRQWLSGNVLQQQVDYWIRQLKDSPTLLTLPTDHPRPIVQSHQGATHTFEISPHLTAGLYALNQQTQTTLFMSLVAAFNILLSRYSGQDDICIGAPIANRNRAEIEDLIGFFVNTLVLRTRIDNTASFETLLEQVRTTTLDAYAHQDVPFEQLVESLQVERHTSHAPLFQVMLVLQNAPLGNLELPGLTLQPITIENTTAKFDLTLVVMEDDGRLLASLEYNTDLFEPATIQRMAGHFTHLLEAILAHTAARIRDLPMLSMDEQQQILVEWNNTQAEYPRDRCIHELFEKQVERTPEAVALVFENRQMTYRELNARANQLAHYLHSQGVGPDVLVGICVERSLEMIVGLLAILKAGGAYLPLDPSYPKERLAYMLEDARPVVVLTQTHLQSTLPANSFCLDTQWNTLAGYSTSNPDNTTLPDNLAYVIYTSGSTGKPKGTMLKLNGLANLVHAQVDTFSVQSMQRILQFASFNFDASTSEIFMALSCGATLCLASRDDLTPGEKLEKTLQQLAINVVTLPPVALNLLSPIALPKLETIIVAGEACPASLAAQWSDSYNFFNAYGPTETTVCASIQHCHAGLIGVPPIGYPISNVQVYILDATLQPVPAGVAGELYVTGDGLARGYLNRPDLTAEKFIPNPFSNEPGARMYRTGDLARWLPDGNIEFLGRIDHQVKIRGFRIELGEIETALTALPEVCEVVVLAREDIPGDKRLVAYLTMREGHNLPRVSELRSRLAQSLPEYMLPAHFLQLEQLPLTHNGKVDRNALPAPDMTRRNAGYVAPRTPTEESLAQIWAEVLHLDKVGIHDNFFELGGHSLMAVRLMARIQRTFQYQIPLSSLFQSPTLEQFAGLVAARTAPSWSPIVPIQSHGSRRPLFCIHEVTGFASFYADLAQHLGPEQPVYGLQARGLDQQQALHTSIQEMAICYRDAIQQVQPRGPYLLIGHSMGGMIAYEISRQLRQSGEEVAFLGLLDTYIHIPSDAPEPADEKILIEYLRQADQLIEHPDQIQVVAETGEEKVIKAFTIAQQAGLVPADLCLADFQRYFEVYKMNIHAASTYQPQPYSGAATLFVCQEHPAQDAAVKQANIDCWNNLVNKLELYEVPGNHRSMVLPPHVDYLAAEISNRLKHMMPETRI